MKTRWLRTGPLAACAELCCKKPQASLPALMIAVRFGAGGRFALPGIARRRLLRALQVCGTALLLPTSGADDTNALTSLTTSQFFPYLV